MFLPATMYKHKGCCSWNTIHHSSAVCSNNAETSNAAVGTLCPLIMLCSFVFKDVRNYRMFCLSIYHSFSTLPWLNFRKQTKPVPSTLKKSLTVWRNYPLTFMYIWMYLLRTCCVFQFSSSSPETFIIPSLVDNNNMFITHSRRISPKNPSESLPLLVNPLFARKNSITPGFHSMRCDQKVHIFVRKTLDGRAFHL